MKAPQTIDALPLSVRAEVGTIDAEKRTAELIFSTGAAVTRYDWMSGKRYREVLGMKPENIRLERLNAGAPLLDAHSAYSIGDVLGAVEEDSARVEKGKALATVRFSKRDTVEPIFQDVRDKIIRSVSVGYRVHKFIETQGKNDEMPTREAVDWEPFEVSLVPMPADTGAKVRSGDKSLTNECVLETRDAQQEQHMENEQTTSETIAERNPLDPGAPTGGTRETTTETRTEPTDSEIGAQVERQRIQDIMSACRAARVSTEFQDQLIKDNVPTVEAQRRIFAEMRKRGGDDRGPQHSQSHRTGDVSLGADPMVHVRAGIENALTHRLAPQHFKLEEVGRRYRGMNLLDVARAFLQGRGIRVTDMSKNELAGVALGLTAVRGGMNTTSDFANLLADVSNKTLRAAYDEQPQTFRPLVRVVSLADFKAVNRVQLGDAPALLEIGESGEYTSGTVSDGKETYQLATYGRKFAITRKALINDDTDAFSRVPMMFGRKARVLESNLVWAQITGNPAMGDGNNLFSAAHSNLETDGDVISITSLGRARTSLRQQTSLDGDYLNLSAQYLLVPTTLETVAQQYVAVVQPQQAGNVNPFQGTLQVIAEPRLDANSQTAWYLAASPAQVDIIELGYLEGEEGPMVESRVGFDVDGLEIKARLDVAAKVIDWRGLHKDPGENVS